MVVKEARMRQKLTRCVFAALLGLGLAFGGWAFGNDAPAQVACGLGGCGGGGGGG